MLASAKGRIDFFRMGDDFGTQRGLLLSRELRRGLIGPALNEPADVDKGHGSYYYLAMYLAARERP